MSPYDSIDRNLSAIEAARPLVCLCQELFRYHLQQANNELIFRYDNTPHFPDLPSFPNHKHLRDSVVATRKSDLPDVLKEAQAKGL